MFTSDPRQRPGSAQILKMIDLEFKGISDSVLGIINPEVFNKDKQNVVTPNFFDRCKKYFSRLTTKSEGWVYSALEENELGPKQKYVRMLIVKTW